MIFLLRRELVDVNLPLDLAHPDTGR